MSPHFEHFGFETNLGLIIVKYFKKIIFDIKIEIGIFEKSNVPNFNKFHAFFIFIHKAMLTRLSIFNFGTNLGLTDGKCFIKIIFGIKIETGIFEKSNVPNFNKFHAFFNFIHKAMLTRLSIFNFGTNLGLTDGKCFIKNIFGIKIEIHILEILDALNFNEF